MTLVALEEALLAGDLRQIRSLCAWGKVDLSMRLSSGNTLLHLACDDEGLASCVEPGIPTCVQA